MHCAFFFFVAEIMTRKEYLKNSYKLIKPYFTSEHKKTAWTLLIAIVVLCFAYVYLLILLNQWNNTFYTALQEYQTDVIFSALQDFSILAACYIFVAVYTFYLEQMLEIKWRTYLTEQFVSKWLDKRTYYLLQLTHKDTDNPDQRISEDIRLFTNITLTLGMGFIRALGVFIAFVVILWNLSGKITLPMVNITINGYLVYVALIYATLGTVFAHLIGRKLVGLNYIQQQYEANFRYSMVRLRENSENIAFYRGENNEKATFINYFTDVITNFWEILKKRKQLTWYNSIYSQIAIIFPFLVLMPRYLAKEIRLGGLMQIASAFGKVQESLSFFVDAYSRIAEWQAVIDRLHGFEQDMQEMRDLDHKQITFARTATNELNIEQLTVLLPNNKVLIKDLHLQLNSGDNILVKGASGSGKSTLMRTLAGLWLFGEGNITCVPTDQMLFLPQRTYLPLGSLRAAVLYPGHKEIPDSMVKLTLHDLGLEHLIEELDRVADWSRILSLGEQQRIAIARAILLKPKWLFLDEATSALDTEIEARAYTALQQIPGVTLVSVAHKPTLTQFHSKELRLLGDGKWRIS